MSDELNDLFPTDTAKAIRPATILKGGNSMLKLSFKSVLTTVALGAIATVAFMAGQTFERTDFGFGYGYTNHLPAHEVYITKLNHTLCKAHHICERKQLLDALSALQADAMTEETINRLGK